ncbi:MAG: 2Fe-2S iron-sulfur cluster binding domain-containing protein, partial [Silicimonas sp.]|nr:2Fe-2S iron-sulfur cluster binding domain-containing protein [Silicimonas sp.]
MSDTTRFTLDGQEVEAREGETIWAVAKRQGNRIPHLCHKDAPGYRPDGNCRACMVAIEGERVLAASCIRTPKDGMVVTTTGAREVAARKMVMEMLVADQPARDAAHDKSSHLWDMADAQGIETSRFPRLEEGRIPLLDDSHVAGRLIGDQHFDDHLAGAIGTVGLGLDHHTLGRGADARSGQHPLAVDLD